MSYTEEDWADDKALEYELESELDDEEEYDRDLAELERMWRE